MSTTVRIRAEDKDRLQRLQAAWHRTAGERPSQQDLLGKGLAYLERHLDEFLREASWRPMSREQARAYLDQFQSSWGPTDVTSEIDEVVYGDPHGDRR